MAASVIKLSDATLSVDAQIGRRVHQLMWDRGMSQTQFGALAHMDQSSVAKRLRGKIGWSASQIVDAARILDTTVGFLFGDGERTPPGNESHLGDSNSRPIHYKPVNLREYRARRLGDVKGA